MSGISSVGIPIREAASGYLSGECDDGALCVDGVRDSQEQALKCEEGGMSVEKRSPACDAPAGSYQKTDLTPPLPVTRRPRTNKPPPPPANSDTPASVNTAVDTVDTMDTAPETVRAAPIPGLRPGETGVPRSPARPIQGPTQKSPAPSTCEGAQCQDALQAPRAVVNHQPAPTSERPGSSGLNSLLNLIAPHRTEVGGRVHDVCSFSKGYLQPGSLNSCGDVVLSVGWSVLQLRRFDFTVGLVGIGSALKHRQASNDDQVLGYGYGLSSDVRFNVTGFAHAGVKMNLTRNGLLKSDSSLSNMSSVSADFCPSLGVGSRAFYVDVNACYRHILSAQSKGEASVTHSLSLGFNIGFRR